MSCPTCKAPAPMWHPSRVFRSKQISGKLEILDECPDPFHQERPREKTTRNPNRRADARVRPRD